MNESTIILLFIMALGILCDNKLIAAGAGTLLVLRVLKLTVLLGALERRSLELGLVLLVIAVLLPFDSGQISTNSIIATLFSLPGLIAICGGVFASYMNQRGVALLQHNPEIIVGLLTGTILGVIFFDGIPVGPLAAAGITAMLLMLVQAL